MNELLVTALEAMKALAKPEYGSEAWRRYDEEQAHSEADDILCDVLEALGHEELVEAWHKVGKWYS